MTFPLTCPWCRRGFQIAPAVFPYLPSHTEERGGCRTCPGSLITPDDIRPVADIRYRNGWDRMLPAHP